MRNDLSSSGIGEDLIRAFTQMIAGEMHLKTLYEKTIAEMENGIADMSDEKVRTEYIKKTNDYLEDIEHLSDIRRRTMLKTFELFDGGDRDVWCMVKHLAVANMQVWEAYCGSDKDVELLELALQSNEMLVSYITRFLGAEVTSCAACLSDFLKGGNDGKGGKKP